MQESGALWAEPGELERPQGVVVDALHGQCAMITLHRGGAARSIAVVPLLRDPQWPEAGSLLMFGTSEDLPGGAGALGDFCREHRITQAERQVLAALASGTSPQDIARSGGVAISTVRTQIASVRRKVRASSIRHLIQMVATLPPWSGVPDD
jgi:DNA-binding CsgD family transcriptional regulator